jgi:hypothetical protein
MSCRGHRPATPASLAPAVPARSPSAALQSSVGTGPPCPRRPRDGLTRPCVASTSCPPDGRRPCRRTAAMTSTNPGALTKGHEYPGCSSSSTVSLRPGRENLRRGVPPWPPCLRAARFPPSRWPLAPPLPRGRRRVPTPSSEPEGRIVRVAGSLDGIGGGDHMAYRRMAATSPPRGRSSRRTASTRPPASHTLRAISSITP